MAAFLYIIDSTETEIVVDPIEDTGVTGILEDITDAAYAQSDGTIKLARLLVDGILVIDKNKKDIVDSFMVAHTTILDDISNHFKSGVDHTDAIEAVTELRNVVDRLTFSIVIDKTSSSTMWVAYADTDLTPIGNQYAICQTYFDNISSLGDIIDTF